MSFQSIRGQDRAIDILKGHLNQGRLLGGYIFSGPEGVGKKAAAKELAKALNCLNRSGLIDSCGACPSCKRIETSQYPDVHIIDGSTASLDRLGTNPERSRTGSLTINPERSRRIEDPDAEIKIESIRQLQRDISLRPYEGAKKIFIIDDAHRFTAEASNAVLKILEEPPADSLIILITDKPALLFKTVISRCKVVKFSPLKRQQLKSILELDFGLDNNQAHFLAYYAEGSLGSALRLKDADYFTEKNAVIDNFVFSPKPDLDNLSSQNCGKVRSSLNILAAWFRDIYLVKAGAPYSEIINLDRRGELLKATNSFSFWELDEILEAISNSISRLEQNINVKLLLYSLREKLWKG